MSIYVLGAEIFAFVNALDFSNNAWMSKIFLANIDGLRYSPTLNFCLAHLQKSLRCLNFIFIDVTCLHKSFEKEERSIPGFVCT